jgi:uncharacterized membrane protein (GlpM family)
VQAQAQGLVPRPEKFASGSDPELQVERNIGAMKITILWALKSLPKLLITFLGMAG